MQRYFALFFLLLSGFSCANAKSTCLFFEINPTFSIYDSRIRLGEKDFRSDISMDITGGVSLGNNFKLGILYSPGYEVLNSVANNYSKRANINLIGEFFILCDTRFNPYIYGIFGLSIDKFSRELIDFNCQQCKNAVKPYLDGTDKDIAYPINYGFGCGIELPIDNKLFGYIDCGYRFYSYGDRQIFSNIRFPIREHINSYIIRIGIKWQ